MGNEKTIEDRKKSIISILMKIYNAERLRNIFVVDAEKGRERKRLIQAGISLFLRIKDIHHRQPYM